MGVSGGEVGRGGGSDGEGQVGLALTAGLAGCSVSVSVRASVCVTVCGGGQISLGCDWLGLALLGFALLCLAKKARQAKQARQAAS